MFNTLNGHRQKEHCIQIKDSSILEFGGTIVLYKPIPENGDSQIVGNSDKMEQQFVGNSGKLKLFITMSYVTAENLSVKQAFSLEPGNRRHT